MTVRTEAVGYMPTPDLAKVHEVEFRSLMEIVSDAAREAAEFVYVAWKAGGDDRREPLDNARQCLDTAATYLAMLRDTAQRQIAEQPAAGSGDQRS